ncbi:MAG: flagellar biosynthesis protein FlhF, partial [Acidobacteriota bacterium]
MKIKTFYAKSMAEALRTIKRELGPDALILATKEKTGRTGIGLRNRNLVEVVAAIDGDKPGRWQGAGACDGEDGGIRESAAASGSAPAAGSLPEPMLYSPPSAVSLRSLDGLQIDPEYNEMRRVLHAMSRPLHPAPSLFPDAVAYELYQDLVTNEISEWLAYKLLDEAQRQLPQQDCRGRAALMQCVAAVARNLLPDRPSGECIPSRRIVAFVGPTGVGKTSAAAKLGARLALQEKKNVILMTTDTSRIGGIDQLRIYAGLMGLPFRPVAQISELPQMLADSSQRDFILIDTAGRAQRDLDSMQELWTFLRTTPGIERHLVISATT